jgi:hypothetical protein
MSQEYTFPGGFTFISRLAETHGDVALVGPVSRLNPVRECMDFLARVGDAPPGEARDDLLRRAASRADVLRAGLAVIQDAVREVITNVPGLTDPTGGQGIQGALPTKQRDQFRPRIGDIRSAPIDPYELGVSGTAPDRPRPPAAPPAPPPPSPAQMAARAADDEAQRIAREGTDEGMSGGPPRPDTGVNQTFNQTNVPTIYDQPVQSAATYKQDDNPPYHEPNESDDGTGPELAQVGPDQGSGLTHGAALAGMRQTPTREHFGMQPLAPAEAEPVETGAADEPPSEPPPPERPRTARRNPRST